MKTRTSMQINSKLTVYYYNDVSTKNFFNSVTVDNDFKKKNKTKYFVKQRMRNNLLLSPYKKLFQVYRCCLRKKN